MLVVTVVATHTLLIELAVLIFLGDRSTAGMALIIVTLLQLVVDRHAVIEDETLTLPLGIGLRLLFQIFQYPAL